MARRTRTSIAALACLLVSALAPGDALAFCRSSTCRTTAAHECETDDEDCPAEGAKLFWPSRCVSWAMNRLGTEQLDPGDTRAIIAKSFAAWSDAACVGGGHASLTFSERDPVACKKSEYNKTSPNVNVVLFQDADWTYRGIDGTLAKTSVTYNDDSGEIYDADIEVNAANNDLTVTDDPNKVSYDLQAILTHEVGHFLGLAHAPDPSSVMYASYSPGSTSQRDLVEDDLDAICSVYPPDDPRPCNVEPRNGFSATCDDDPPPSGICSTAPAAPSSGASPIVVCGAFAFAFVAVRRRARRARPR